jgi:hypothetical protein
MKAIVLFLLAAAIASAAIPSGIAPMLGCVSFDENTNILTATFGYVNANAGTVLLSVGPENFVSPNPSNRGQTTAFLPGAQRNAWQTSFDVTQTAAVTWTVLGQSVTAVNDPNVYCSTCSCPPGPMGPDGPAGSQGPPGIAGVLGPLRIVTVPSATAAAVASCVTGEVLLSGGASCSLSGAAGKLVSTSASGLHWNVSCDGGQATAIAFCLSASPPPPQ